MDRAITAVLCEDVDASTKRHVLQTVLGVLGDIHARPKEEREQSRCVQKDDPSLRGAFAHGGLALFLAAGFSDDGSVLRYPPSRDAMLAVKLRKLEERLQGDLTPPRPPVAQPAQRPVESVPVFTIADPDEALEQLVSVQTRRCPEILQELEQHGRKRSCWMWWICPHEMEGACDPQCTRVTRATAQRLCESDAVDGWRAVLEKLCDLVEADGMHVLPSIDHGRVCLFLKFWQELPEKPEWMTSVLKRLGRYDWRPTSE